ncbi:serine transporter [Endomicrobiia bacterium]|uniref:amino acid permease n=1 Tax=Endomicrobium trichonymphae TaxID=1408204 RepID=UPI000864C996|nr:amino acid permease [Candidatus Endomicrobium trichonymphae]GHT04750.1 serine transporter [Endomicrobiia bacterium]BAV59275.1 serine transporter [Candidatus Endomicrobium trichonymphae]GHT12040.1 serine transporter [Endomicrobiia bacterium]GHT15105.1 serine transporter [Endomicrobiia bacterium]GHT20892.1 serine transporter [Endomicrobiia bacterium]
MNNFDRGWILTCFGTAVGAGMLFLPIQAGPGGIWPVILLALIIFPLTYVSHSGITRIVASCPEATDIVGAIEHDLGRTVGFTISILYFLSIVSACIGYSIGLTNIINTFLVNQMHLTEISRPLLTLIILLSMTAMLFGNEKTVVLVTSALTFPLIVLLVFVSAYMIPHWNLSILYEPTTIRNFTKHSLLLLPLLVFAMNFSPVCSSLAAFYRKQYNRIDEAIKHTDLVVKWTSVLLLIFVMFFVISLCFCITPEILFNANKNNTDALTTLSLAYNSPILQYIFPVVSFLAIASSYFGHFEGTREGLNGIIVQIITWKNPARKSTLDLEKMRNVSTAVLFAIIWFLSVSNLSILFVLGALSAPIVAIYAYLMPVMMMKRIPRLLIYRSKLAAFVFVMGIFTLVGYYVGKIM